MDKPELKRRRRSQRDYSMAFKLSVVEQVEKGEMTYKQAQKRYGIQGRSTVLVWLRKHGRQDWSHERILTMPRSSETPAQTIKRLERELEDAKLRVEVLDLMVDDIDENYGTQIRKKLLAEQPELFKRKKDDL